MRMHINAALITSPGIWRKSVVLGDPRAESDIVQDVRWTGHEMLSGSFS
jgi:hypothetical protein